MATTRINGQGSQRLYRQKWFLILATSFNTPLVSYKLSSHPNQAPFILLGYMPHTTNRRKRSVRPHSGTCWKTDILTTIPQPEPVYVVGDYNVRLQGRFSAEQDFLGPHIYGKGKLAANTKTHSNRTFYTSLLKSLGFADALSFKQSNLTKHVTYRDKFSPPDNWDQFILDPLILLQMWDRFATLPLPESDQLSLVSEIRAFLGLDTLPPNKLATPHIDPVRFQSLDRLITPRKWLPTIRTVKAVHNTGFPSDHYLLLTELSVRLGARRQRQPRPPLWSTTPPDNSARSSTKNLGTHYI